MIKPRKNSKRIIGSLVAPIKEARGISLGSMDGLRTRLSIVTRGRKERNSRSSKRNNKQLEDFKIRLRKQTKPNRNLTRLETQHTESGHRGTGS